MNIIYIYITKIAKIATSPRLQIFGKGAITIEKLKLDVV